MRKLPGIALAVALVLAAALPTARASQFQIPVEQYQLGNGLKVVLSEDHASPTVAVAVYYNVGSRDEKKGYSGFAHLFEHMMFQGSAHVKKAQHYEYVENNGGVMNGSTHAEFTNYFELMPSNQLNLALWLEADRMRSLAVTQTNLDNQRQVVEEELRLRVANQPYAPSFIEMSALLYHDWKYAHPTIGSIPDLNAAKLAQVQDFHRIYYAPNNAALAVCGDFDSVQARKWIQEHFGGIPSQPAPHRPAAQEAPGVAKAAVTNVDKLAKVPAVLMGWKVPGFESPDSAAIDLLSTILGGGDSSVLYQTLVKEKQMAVSCDAGYDEDYGPSDFTAFVVQRPGTDARSLASEIDTLVAEIRDKGVTAGQLDRARALYKAGRFSNDFTSLQTPLGRAMALAWAATFEPDGAADVNKEVARYDAVTPAQVQEVAKKYFTPANRAIITIETAAQNNSAPAPESQKGKGK